MNSLICGRHLLTKRIKVSLVTLTAHHISEGRFPPDGWALSITFSTLHYLTIFSFLIDPRWKSPMEYQDLEVWEFKHNSALHCTADIPTSCLLIVHRFVTRLIVVYDTSNGSVFQVAANANGVTFNSTKSASSRSICASIPMILSVFVMTEIAFALTWFGERNVAAFSLQLSQDALSIRKFDPGKVELYRARCMEGDN